MRHSDILQRGAESPQEPTLLQAGDDPLLQTPTRKAASKLAVLRSFSAVYLLPGDQSQFTRMAMEGDVEDNVTVVLVRNVNTLSTSTVMLV